ncbi:MAG: hypothetical protein JST01_11470 [Cyanobacteria bacterium SZAS TMP-1]|nr:hypothetical protein [Cyanobacteria bacterium SZAS TMP-1]
MVRLRTQRAASLVMVVALIVVITIIAVVAVQLITLFGGGQQVQRATDSGNLSVARSALVNIQVPLPGSGDQLQFDGVSDKVAGSPHGVINLRNINRVMGEALLVNLNAYAINQAGLDAGANTHAAQINTAANNICTALKGALTTSPQMQAYFSSTSNKQPTTQYGANNLSPANRPTFSYLNRKTASNVWVVPQQMPDFNFTTNSSTIYNNKVAGWVTDVSSDSSHKYIKGYMDGISPASNYQDVHFMPLKPGDRPHLVSQGEFNQFQNPSSGPDSFSWASPAPNTLSIAATDKTNANEGAYTGGFNAFAIVEPIDPVGFSTILPHGFIRILNGAASPTTGVAAGASDVFVYVMNNPQFYVTSTSGTALPYFVGTNDTPLPYGSATPADYVNHIVADIAAGTTPDCSALSVGYTLAGDSLGLGGVSQANCQSIAGIGGGSPINNITLDQAGSTSNNDMASYNHSDNRGLWARPVLEAAYNISPATPTGSNGQSVNVADILNLQMLSARATGDDFHAGTYQSGIANLPATPRGALASPNFKVADQRGALLGSNNPEGLKLNGTMYNFVRQRMYQIDPNWTTYSANLDAILNQDYVPMGGRAYIYFSQNANGGRGGIVLKNETNALADAPWLSNFVGQPVDAKSPVNPTEVRQQPVPNDSQVDVSGDWDYPHPYDIEGQVCIMDWYSFTPSSGFNNLLGQIDLGAVTTNCCADGSNNVTTSFTVNYGATSDTLNLSAGCSCTNDPSCTYGGPC